MLSRPLYLPKFYWINLSTSKKVWLLWKCKSNQTASVNNYSQLTVVKYTQSSGAFGHLPRRFPSLSLSVAPEQIPSTCEGREMWQKVLGHFPARWSLCCKWAAPKVDQEPPGSTRKIVRWLTFNFKAKFEPQGAAAQCVYDIFSRSF